MSEKVTYPLRLMQEAASALAVLLKPNIKQGKVCGSVRRQKPLCADIELVYEPLPDVAVSSDLFGNPQESVNPSLAFIDHLLADGVLQYRLNSKGLRTWGRENRLALFAFKGKLIPVDLFAVYNPGRWGTHVAIRTGSADFNKKMLTRCRQGGWLPDHLTMREGFGLFEFHTEIPCPTEESFFKAIGVQWIDPRERHAWANRPRAAVADYCESPSSTFQVPTGGPA